ncbi:hypothetical protein ACR77V_12710 [Staphylococcus epidermidis]|uniref:hypothetical protein n=1 Tax=Staphylococcus epidermidis TaxID=1282 RepID=UPI003DA4953A
MAKATLIELEIPQGRMAFPIEQADALLRMKFNGGWKLPEDSEWTWSAEKGFEKKSKAVKGSMGGVKLQRES